MNKKPTAFLSKIVFSGGQEFSFCQDEKVILVGSNNSGKSQTLREIIMICDKAEEARTIVLKNIEISKNGKSDDLKNFLEQCGKYENDRYIYNNWSINQIALRHWDISPYLRFGLFEGYIKNINANNRLAICQTQKSIGPNQQKTKPQHILYDDPTLMQKISNLFRQAFGQDIMIDYRGGSEIPFHVGQLPDQNLKDRVGNEYIDAVRSNPRLDQQGDGMKSYAGILFETIVSNLDMTLLDEPEAFLHPPQMRRLGQTLASEVSGQLFIATHSSDIMRGFLEGTHGNVRVLRIRREGQYNFVTEAEPEIIKELWATPVLRYSNALEGVFHEQTILCEDDSDCRLFNAIADHLAEKDTFAWKDTAYVPTGGKHTVKTIAKVLRKIGVPIKVVFDIDFLSEKEIVKDTVKAFGGEWTDIEHLWGRVDSAIRDGKKPKSIEDIKSELMNIIQSSAENKLPKSDISEAMKQTSSWNIMKKFGVAALPNGEVQSDYKKLKEYLENIGIYLVQVGEIENFCKCLGVHGPKFVNKLLRELQLDDERLADLRDFVATFHKGNHAPFPNT